MGWMEKAFKSLALWNVRSNLPHLTRFSSGETKAFGVLWGWGVCRWVWRWVGVVHTVLASVFHGKATDFGELIIHGKRPFTVKICRLEFNSSRMKIWLSR
jgi:hypothetical protein